MNPSNPSRASCPSCGRFVGPLEKCPYCGASVKKRIPLNSLRIGSLFLALVGVAILLYVTSGTATPTIKIGDISATMNYAYVRVQGQVTRGPLFDRDSQELAFYVADDTGEIRATAFRATSQQLIQLGRVPEAGDSVKLEATVRVRDDYQTLNVASPDKLLLVKPEVQAVPIAQIGADDLLQVVTVRADIRDLRTPYEGLTLVTLGDATGELDLAITRDLQDLYGALEPIQLGDSVQVTGTVTLYRDTPQLALTRPQNLMKLESKDAPDTTISIGDLDMSRVGQRVLVTGLITSSRPFSRGEIVMLGDGTGEIALVLWDDLIPQLPNFGVIGTTAWVQALGRLSAYRGVLEIIPSRASDIQIPPRRLPTQAVQNSATPSPTYSILSTAVQHQPTHTSTATPTAKPAQTRTPQPSRTLRPSWTPTPAPVERTIGSLTFADKDIRVIVAGQITRANSFSQGMRYTLDDGTGKITLLIWSDILEKIADRAMLVKGAQVRVVGKIDIFDNALEIIPQRAGDVILVAASSIPTAAPRDIASLSTNDLDQIVIVRGSITAISDFSRGKYVTLKDNGGEILVTLFSNVLEGIGGKLTVGTSISVRGRVNLYRGELELVPEEGGITMQ